MGFRRFSQTFHTQQTALGPHRLFTIVASRDSADDFSTAAAEQAPTLHALQERIRRLREEMSRVGGMAK